MREFVRLGRWLLALGVVIAGCTTTEGNPSTTTTHAGGSTTTVLATTTTGSQTTTSAPTTTTSIVRRDQYERLCTSRISSGYGPPDVTIPILHVGPVAFLDLDFEQTASERDFTFYPENGYVGLKYVTVVDRNAVGPVTLTIDEASRESAGLIYDPTRWGRRTLGGSDHTVVFQVCRTLDAQFNGGFIVAEPMCLRITVTDGVTSAEGDVAAQSWSAAIPFGVAPETCTE
jgi:hypothetical protein